MWNTWIARGGRARTEVVGPEPRIRITQSRPTAKLSAPRGARSRPVTRVKALTVPSNRLAHALRLTCKLNRGDPWTGSPGRSLAAFHSDDVTVRARGHG